MATDAPTPTKLLEWLDKHSTDHGTNRTLLRGYQHEWRTLANRMWRCVHNGSMDLSTQQLTPFHSFCLAAGINPDAEQLMMDAAACEQNSGQGVLYPVEDMRQPNVMAEVRAALALMAGGAKHASEAADIPKSAAPGSVNARMLDAIQNNAEAMGWGCKEWAEYLKCSKPSVTATKTWKDLAMGRDRVKAEKAVDSRRGRAGTRLTKRTRA